MTPSPTPSTPSARPSHLSTLSTPSSARAALSTVSVVKQQQQRFWIINEDNGFFFLFSLRGFFSHGLVGCKWAFQISYGLLFMYYSEAIVADDGWWQSRDGMKVLPNINLKRSDLRSVSANSNGAIAHAIATPMKSSDASLTPVLLHHRDTSEPSFLLRHRAALYLSLRGRSSA